MSNTRKYQFLYSKVPMLTFVDCTITVGSSGAVSSSTGALVNSVTLPTGAVGQYLINLTDNYNAFIDMFSNVKAPISASPTAITALTPGLAYSISTLGSATRAQWTTAGVPTNVTPAVGVFFVAAATSAGASSAAKPVISSGLYGVVLVGTNTYQTSAGNSAFQILVQCVGPTATADTALIPTNPVSGSVLELGFWLRDSTVAY